MAKPTMNSTGIGSTPMISAVISATVRRFTHSSFGA
jgi:hypothetical protein